MRRSHLLNQHLLHYERGQFYPKHHNVLVRYYKLHQPCNSDLKHTHMTCYLVDLLHVKTEPVLKSPQVKQPVEEPVEESQEETSLIEEPVEEPPVEELPVKEPVH